MWRSAGAVHGSTHEPDTRDRVPVFLPNDAGSGAWRTNAASQIWIDDVLGCDVHAVPSVRSGDGIAFLPPRTGKLKIRRGRFSLRGNDENDPSALSRLSPTTSQSCLARFPMVISADQSIQNACR